MHAVDRGGEETQGDAQLQAVRAAPLKQSLDPFGGVRHGQVLVFEGVSGHVVGAEPGLEIVVMQQGLEEPEGLQRDLLRCHEVMHSLMKASGRGPCNPPCGLSRIAVTLEERVAMAIAANVLTLLVILIHVYIVVLEMALWRTRGPKVFGITPEFARDSAALASNQGLYNGFLVVALVLGLALREPYATAFVFYGLGCVVVAGLWGALTASRRILYVQALPAAIALAAQWLAR